MDFEEELEQFFIRRETGLNSIPETTAELKKSSISKQLNLYKHVFNYIPLMLKDLKKLNENSWTEGTNVIKIFDDKVHFKHCLVYGKIMSRGKESKSSYNYLLDDGTATLEISLFRRTKDMETVWKLENELQAVKRRMLAQNKNEIMDSLRNLLFKTKEQIDPSKVTLGSKVLLYCRPTYFRGEISLNVYSLIEDGKTNRDVEIAFKDSLIDWYTNNCTFSTKT